MQASQDLFDLLVSKDFTVKTLDSKGKPVVDPNDAEMFSFDFEVGNHNYGTVVLLLDDKQSMEVYYGDNVGKNMEGDDKDAWYDFLNHIKRFATRNLHQFNLKNINRLRYTMQGMAAINEGLFEGWNGTKMTSYNNKRSNVRLKIVHDKPMEETDQRWRAVKTMFIETPEGERFKLPFKSTSAGKAMTRHVMEGGNPYDTFGNHIVDIVRETNALARFLRGKTRQVTEQHEDYELVQEFKERYKSLRKRLKQITGKRGYHSYRESWNPAQIEEGVVGKLAKRLGKAALKHGAKIAVPAALGTGIAFHDAAEKEKAAQAAREKAPTAQVVDKKKDMKINDLKEADHDLQDGDLVQFVGDKYDGKQYILADIDGQWWAVDPENIKFGYSVMNLSDLEPADEELEEGRVKERYMQLSDMLDGLDEHMQEEGLYGDVDKGAVINMIITGDIGGAMQEIYAAYADQEGGEGEYAKGPIVDDFEQELMNIMDTDMNVTEQTDSDDYKHEERKAFQNAAKYFKETARKHEWSDEDIRAFNYVADKLDFIGRGGNDILAKSDRFKKDIVTRQEILNYIQMQDTIVRDVMYEDLEKAFGTKRKNFSPTTKEMFGELAKDTVEESADGVKVKWIVTMPDGTEQTVWADDNAGQQLKKKYPDAKISCTGIKKDEELYDDAKANNMKELNEFENWADEVTSVAEGGYTPLTDKQLVNALVELMSEKQPAGLEGATIMNKLQTSDPSGDILYDEDLFDALRELDSEADARGTILAWLEDKMPEVANKVMGNGDAVEEAWRPDARFKAGMEVPMDAGPDSGMDTSTDRFKAGMEVPSDAGPDGGAANDRYSPPTKDGVSPPTRRLGEKKSKPDYIDLDDDGDTEESMKKAARDKAMKEEHDLDTSEPVKKPERDPMLEANDWMRLAGLASTVYEPVAEETVEEAYSDMEDPVAAAKIKDEEDFGIKVQALKELLQNGSITMDEYKEEVGALYKQAMDMGMIESNQSRIENAISEEWEDEGLDDRAAAQQLDKMLADGKSLLAAAQELASYYGVEPYEVVDAGDAYGSPETKKLLAGFRKLLGTDLGEGNAFSGALAQAKKDGKSEFEVDGKKYKVKEGFEDNSEQMLRALSVLMGTSMQNVEHKLSQRDAETTEMLKKLAALLKSKQMDEADAGKYGQADFDERETQGVAPGANTDMPEKVEEREMTDAEMKKREEIVQAMKSDTEGFKKRYGDRWEEVMYATATKQAMGEGMADVMGDEEIEDPFPELPQVAHDGNADDYASKYDVDDSHVGVKGKDTADDDLSWIKRALGNK